MSSRFIPFFKNPKTIDDVQLDLVMMLGFEETLETAKEICRRHREIHLTTADEYYVAEYSDSDWKSDDPSSLYKIAEHAL